MKFTFDWLQEHLRTDMTYQQIADRLTTLGIEVEEIIDNREKYKNFVVGFIENAEKHPNADRLRVCQVNIGDKTLQIVCGAPNARAGIHVVVALVGAIIPVHGEELKKGKIRGIESQGMMCSSQELLLGEESDGIIELPATAVPGKDLVTALGIDDVIFDVSITPNRADCFSVRGIARDLSAIGAGELLELDECEVVENIENPVDIEIITPSCDYFSTIAICNISGQTPGYIAKRLKAVGQNLVSLPVDIANYICLDIGQPLHIYDLDKLPPNLQIRDSRQGEILETLNN
ncbi:MAG: phenylalanine--tRNA ligase subunit beta, partial [Alphaproteobacteria bacterium]|nr:phenylalanine--tRNA ligase subunit beta [Alphaproteobacteria bacterium]